MCTPGPPSTKQHVSDNTVMQASTTKLHPSSNYQPPSESSHARKENILPNTVLAKRRNGRKEISPRRKCADRRRTLEYRRRWLAAFGKSSEGVLIHVNSIGNRAGAGRNLACTDGEEGVAGERKETCVQFRGSPLRGRRGTPIAESWRERLEMNKSVCVCC